MSENRIAGLSELMATAARLLGMLNNNVTESMNASSLEKERPSIWFARKYVRGCLLRILSLGTSTMGELERNNFASAALLSRSVIETSAMLELFHNNLRKVSTDNDPEKLRTVVSSHYLGTKAFELAGSAKAPHVMDAVRAANKKEGWIQSVYDMLSDVAHPNWAGTTQLFLDDVGRWGAESHINREFAIDLATNILLGLYAVRLALGASNHIEGVLNELTVSAKTRGI
jgi:hypothetical protein